MGNSSVDLTPRPIGGGGREIDLPIHGGANIHQGTFVSQLNAGTGLVPGSTASSGPAVGVALFAADNTNGADGALRMTVMTDRVFSFANGTNSDACSEATALFSVVYMGDDHTVFATSDSSTLQPAGLFMGMEPDGRVRVYVGMRRLTSTELADLAATGGAGLVGILDAGGFTAQTTVEGALAEIYQSLETTKRVIPINVLAGITLAAGVGVSAAAPSSSIPGTAIADSKSAVVKWLAHATPAALCVNVPMPSDLDDTANVVFHALVSKSGATVGDATSLTVAAFEVVPGALHDADVDFGGATTAVVGNATAKTVTELTLTLTAANVHAYPEAICLQIKPTAGLLGTDNFYLHAAWLEIKTKILTS